MLLNPYRFAPPAGGGGSLPAWANVTALLPLDGNATAAKGGAWSNTGSAPTYTASNPPFTGVQSLEMLGTTASLISAASAGQLGAGDFGVEILFRCTSTAGSFRALAGNYDGDGLASWGLWLNASGQPYFYGDSTGLEMFGGPDCRDSAWRIVQLIRQAGRLSVRVGKLSDGGNTTECAFATGNATNFNSTKGVRIGLEAAYMGSPFYGQLAQFRATVGEAPPIAVPTAAWPTS